MNFQDPILTEAKKDFQYLLERGFPRTGALEYVGNHYLLGEMERNYLNRTVFPRAKIESRKDKLILLADIEGKDVLLDGYNVLITVETMLQGVDELVVNCDDGVIRDVKAVFGKYKKNENTEPALNSIISLLKIFKPKNVLFFFDSPVSLSGELARATREILESQGVPGDAQTSENVDKTLIDLSYKLGGVVATSDGIIMDKVDLVLDVPGYVSKFKRIKN
ncbi:DUF434 domain-containing protein [Methanobacterium formicicum]|uniref:DUF434 domain-containing protein n=1 Tax=Methanobacterium formicicum TaxID=2162 RepID=A0A089ZUX8_METFO|nr:DUF434 domain-containing protein [Methanobacterium formicicum]AIS31459.1 hypothetical protein BRM9_0636 [Methanobacterium formicicum]MDG3547693.1 DUF434 domain-containing protein [Methanobacterium formicicum]CEL25311.1 hypothetical protein MB9_1676 [Methanobacterium formicicum]